MLLPVIDIPAGEIFLVNCHQIRITVGADRAHHLPAEEQPGIPVPIHGNLEDVVAVGQIVIRGQLFTPAPGPSQVKHFPKI